MSETKRDRNWFKKGDIVAGNPLVTARFQLKQGVKREDLPGACIAALDAFERHRSNQFKYTKEHPQVPRLASTRAIIREFARLRIVEGLNIDEAAKKLGKVRHKLSVLCGLYKHWYRICTADAMEELDREVQGDARAEILRTRRRMIAMSRQSDDVLQSILDDPAANSFARLQARRQVKQGLGMDESAAASGGSYNEFVRQLHDVVGLVKELRPAVPPDPHGPKDVPNLEGADAEE